MAGLKILMAPLATLLFGCATLSPMQHVPRPGYTCIVGQSFVDDVWASSTLDDNGSQVHAEWGWRNRKFSSPVELMVTSKIAGGAELRPDRGWAVVSTRALERSGRNERHRLELTTDPGAPFLQVGPFAGSFTRNEELRIHANWPDLLAFSGGASRLILIVRNHDGEITDRADVDPSLITNGSKEVAPILDRLAELTRDYRDRCERSDDIEPVIIVT
jgi:hypothetical protein